MKAFLKRTQGFFTVHPNADWLLLVGGLVVFAVLGLWNISAASIWFDEAFSAYIAQFSLVDIVRYTAADVHPPMYYWLLSLWQSLFGQSELALRSMSLLFAGVAILFAYLFVRRWFGRKAALLSLLFLVLSPMLLRYGQEARMYTLSAAIVMAGTYVVSIAVESKRKLPWIVYSLLVALGVWVHYFAALAWLGHWVWRAMTTWQSGKRGVAYLKAFFTKQWVLAYGAAVALFLPWAIVMYQQFNVIQKGFWIGPVTADSPVNYLTHFFYYQNHSQVKDWWVLLLLALIVVISAAAIRAYRGMTKKSRSWYILIASVALVPVLLLLALTVPGRESSFFVERYLIPAVVATSPFIGISIAVGLSRARKLGMTIASSLVVIAMAMGIANVYHYGNYNRNSDTHILTKELVREIHAKAQPGEPIVANSPWTFYEAVYYATDDHPVYFIDANTEYLYGSLDMLKYNDAHKIKDIEAFERDNPVIWYIGTTSDERVAPYQEEWRGLQSIGVHSDITDRTVYRATQYDVSK